jgi:catechol 2,3-dioxygenase-like lactoylglutathione lyase family enzyme
MERARLQAVNPVLPSRNVPAAIEFYVTRLGFTLRFQDDPHEPRYAVLRRDEVVLHVQWHDPAEWQAGVDRPMLRFDVSSVEALFEEYRDKGVFHDRTAVRDTAWGTREFAFFDADHNGLTFYRNL